MTARERLDEMQQFMNIARGDLTEGHVGEVEIGGSSYPWRRVPMDAYAQFKKQYPGSQVRFRGPKLGKQNTSKVDATHFYIVRKGPNKPKPEDMARIQKPEGMRSPHRPESEESMAAIDNDEAGGNYNPNPANAPTPGYYKLGPAAQERARGRAKAFYPFENVSESLKEAATRKDFRMVANLISKIEDLELRQSSAKDHADMFALQNPRFNREKFMAAAGVDITEDGRPGFQYENDPDENDASGEMCGVCSGGRREGYGNDCPNCGGEGYVTEDSGPDGMGKYDVVIRSAYGEDYQTGEPIPYHHAEVKAEEVIKRISDEASGDVIVNKIAAGKDMKYKVVDIDMDEIVYVVIEDVSDEYDESITEDSDAECDKCYGLGRKPSGGADCEECNGTGRCPKLDESDEELPPIHAIASDIIKNWKKVNFGAVPYLDAMQSLSTKYDDYGADSGSSILAYGLSNMNSYSGRSVHDPELAKKHRAQLKQHLKEGINLDNIVESVLEEFPGQPKDYEIDPYDEADQREMADDMDDDFEKDYIDPEIEDEELGLRFD